MPDREQEPLGREPYDRWITPEGDCNAEFYRTQNGFLVRFNADIDFEVELPAYQTKGWGVPGHPASHYQQFFDNSLGALVGNHAGGLYLHGSAVDFGGKAAVFLGLARSGKTTLAAACASHGYPWLTEDMIDLRLDGGKYWIQPKRTSLRLFKDSAESILGEARGFGSDKDKQPVEDAASLPFADKPVPVSKIFVLGNDRQASLKISAYPSAEAITQLLPHSFILDVEDKARLKAHFSRLAQLAEAVGCHSLDYPRRYEDLPMVIDAVFAEAGNAA